MNVLVITNEVPLPLDRGGPMRILGLSRALAAEHRVHMLALERPGTTAEHVAELRALLGGEVETFGPEPQGAGAARSAARWARAIAERVPPWVRAQHSPPLARRAAEVARRSDVVALLDDYAGIYARALAPFAPVVCDKHNVMGWTAAEDRSAAAGAAGRIRQGLGVSLIRRFERSCLARAAGVVVTSGEEAGRLEQLYGRQASVVVPSAIDLPAAPARAPGNRTVGWLGSLDYSANVEGLVRFAEQAWEPLGRDGIRLLVAGGGGGTPAGLERLAGVELLGFVDDLPAFMSALDAAVIPLWRGAGVKLKTLSFMAAGVPVAATPVALEGVEGEDGRHYAVADDPGGLAGAVRRLVEDPHGAGRIGAAGRQLVADRYVWERVGPRFVEAVERVASARS